MIKSGIYQIVNTENKKRYIGSSVNIDRRFGKHLRTLRSNSHANRYLQNAYNQNPSVFKFFILELCEIKELLLVEQKYLNILFDDQKNCYNIAKIAGAPMTGRKASEETKKKMSLNSKRVSPSPERREEIRKFFLGKKRPGISHVGGKNIRSRSVDQIDKKTGQVIKTFAAIMDAERELGIGNTKISAVCGGRENRFSAGGFCWKYSEDKK